MPASSEQARASDGWIREPLDASKSGAIESQILRDLYAYWDRLRAGRTMPLKAEVKPADIPLLLPHLGMFEIIDAGRAIKVRLLGTKVQRDVGGDKTGVLIDAKTPDLVRQRILNVLQAIVRDKRPYRMATRASQIRGKDIYSSEGVALPLSAGSDDVAFVLAGHVLTLRTS